MDNLTVPQFMSGVISIIIVQLFAMWNNNRNLKAQAPLTSAQGESAMGDALEKLGQAYDRALNTIKAQDEELKGLRPLILDLALTKQQASQVQLDKDDWKSHATKLDEQLQQHKIIPIVFRRQSTGADTDKIRAITRAQVEKYIGDKEQSHVMADEETKV
jgi:hypothetical protein